MTRGFTSIYIILGILIIGIGVGGYYLGQRNFTPTQIFPAPGNEVCTQDAKQCPDGSYVSRVGPNCEFAACPAPESNEDADETASWRMYTNTKYKYSIKYPPTWKEKVRCNGGLDKDDYVCFLSSDFEDTDGQAVWGSVTKGGAFWIDGQKDLVGHLVKDFCRSEQIKITDCKEIVIGETKAMSRRWIYTTQVGIPDSRNDKIILSLRVVYSKDSEKDIMETFNKVLSTFKFL